jgi:hypothetical protein
VGSNEGRSPPAKLQQETTMRASNASPLFLLGKNRRGNWVVQSQHGLRGGLFVSRAEAFKFALFENGHRPELVITVPGVLELDLSGAAETAVQQLAA